MKIVLSLFTEIMDLCLLNKSKKVLGRHEEVEAYFGLATDLVCSRFPLVITTKTSIIY